MTRFAVVFLPLLFACAPAQPEPAPLPTPIAAPVAVASPGLMGDYAVTLAESDVSANAPEAERKGTVGTWNIAFHGGNHLVVSHNGREVVQGAYQVMGNRITFGEDTGPYACGMPATYTWQVSNGQLTFTPVQDPCVGRVLALTSRPLVRKP